MSEGGEGVPDETTVFVRFHDALEEAIRLFADVGARVRADGMQVCGGQA